jgi:hypothetical protein
MRFETSSFREYGFYAPIQQELSDRLQQGDLEYVPKLVPCLENWFNLRIIINFHMVVNLGL